MNNILDNLTYNFINNISFDHYNVSTTISSYEDFCYSAESFYNSSFGIVIAIPEWEALTLSLMLFIVICGTIFGNTLVIFEVFTYKPLRIVQNFFIVSLAVADLGVAVLVMPLNVAYMILGRWPWGKQLCKMWLTCDIMSCTSSILNLCAIALDRYWAITDPINYAHKRTLKRVIYQIILIWILSLIISSPPFLGWNDWPEEFTTDAPCQLTSEPGYVVYSSLGSFFVPLIIMTIVYIKIYIAASRRLRKRTLIPRLQNRKPKLVVETQTESLYNKDEVENESDSGESIKKCPTKTFMDIKKNFVIPFLLLNDPISRLAIESNINLDCTSTNRCGSCKIKTTGSLRRNSSRHKKQETLLLASVKKSGDVVNQFIEQKQKISLSKERRAARTLGIIMGVFVVCWLPFFLMYIILPFCFTCCPNIRIINIITWLGYVNSTVNPLIYTIFNIEIRRAFKKLLGLNT